MTNKQALELVKNDMVIIRNDGVVMRNKLGAYLVFTEHETIGLNKKINELKAFAQKLGANYTYSPIKYTDLPANLKY